MEQLKPRVLHLKRLKQTNTLEACALPPDTKI
jgi:hypothetical protein